MRHYYKFSVSTGGGTYITDAATLKEAQEELRTHFQRSVIVWQADSKKSPDRSRGETSPGEGEAGDAA